MAAVTSRGSCPLIVTVTGSEGSHTLMIYVPEEVGSCSFASMPEKRAPETERPQEDLKVTVIVGQTLTEEMSLINQLRVLFRHSDSEVKD